MSDSVATQPAHRNPIAEPRKRWNEINGPRHPTKTPKVNRSGEYRPRETGFRPCRHGRSGEPFGYNPRKQRQILAARQSGELVVSEGWRRDRDSNPGWGHPHNGFRDRPVRPLRHLSAQAGSAYADRKRIARPLAARGGSASASDAPLRGEQSADEILQLPPGGEQALGRAEARAVETRQRLHEGFLGR
jgi:hypothetical protein